MTSPSPWTPSGMVGDRVVVRYLLGEATPADWRGNPQAARSDVTGILLDDADPLRLERDGEVVSIPAAAVTSVRVLSAKPVRNSEIRDLELVAAQAWPGVETAWIDGWFARAGHGFTRRANSAVPADRSARADATTLSRLVDWYAERSLPPLLSIPDRLLPAAAIDGVEGVEVQTLTGEPATIAAHLRAPDHDTTDHDTPAPSIRLRPEPDADWLAAYPQGRDTDPDHVRAVLTAGAGPRVFADAAGVHSTGRAVITESHDGTRWLGVTALWSDPSSRRQGLSRRVLAALLEWGVEHDADRVHLQVETGNRVVGTWYRRIGFGLHHHYRYLELAGPTESSGRS